MTTLHVTLAKVTGLWLLLPLLVEGRSGEHLPGAAENHSAQCFKGGEGANCTFDKSLCKWTGDGWEVTQREHHAQLSTDNIDHGVLQSPRICSTHQAAHCLSFHYRFVHQTLVTLTVVLEVEGRGNVPVWQLTDNRQGHFPATAPVNTTADFRILFRVNKSQHHDSGVGSYVMVSNIVYEDTDCSVIPQNAVVSKPAATPKPPATITPKPPTTTTSKAPTTSTSRPFIGRPSIAVISLNTKKPSTATPATRRSRPTRPSVSKRPSPSPSPPSSSAAGSEQSSSMSSKTSDMPVTAASGELPDDSCTGIIIGAVVAVVVIVAVGVFLFVAKRKKMFWFRPKDSSSQPVAMVSLSQRDVVTAPDPASMEGGSANGQSETAGRGNDAPPEGGRHRAAETGRRGTSPTRPAGTGGIQPGPEDGGEYHVVDLVGQRHGPEGARVAGPREGQHVPDDGHYHLPWEDHAPPGAVPAAGSSYLAARGGAEDEYSRLGLAGKKTALAGEKESGGCRLYDHVGGGERDVYSHVQRDREPPVILDQVYSHIH